MVTLRVCLIIKGAAARENTYVTLDRAQRLGDGVLGSGSDVARVVNHRSERALGEEGRSRETDDDEGDDPTRHSLSEDEPVDALTPFKQGDTHGGADLAVSRGKRPAHSRSQNDDTRSAEFNANTSTRGELREFGPERVQDAVTIQSETDDDAKGTKGENPVRVVSHGILLLCTHLASLVNQDDGGKGAD